MLNICVQCANWFYTMVNRLTHVFLLCEVNFAGVYKYQLFKYLLYILENNFTAISTIVNCQMIVKKWKAKALSLSNAVLL